MGEKVAIAIIWHGPEVVIEERWVDTDDGRQEPRYAFPGGKVEAGEREIDAAIREVYEETDIALTEADFTGPEILRVGDDVGFIYGALLRYGTRFKDGVLSWNIEQVMEHKNKGKLLPLTAEFVERNF